MRKIRHDIGRSTAGAGSHKNDTDCQFRRKLEDLCQNKRKKRHDRELCDRSDEYVFRSCENSGKIRRLQCKSHTEHNNSEQCVYPACFDPKTGLRREQRKCRDRYNDPRHILANKIACFFECFHLILLILHVRQQRSPTKKHLCPLTNFC